MPEIPVCQYSVKSFRIRVRAEWDSPDFSDFLMRLSDEATLSGGSLLQGGRNRVVRTRVSVNGVEREIVVKTYGKSSFFQNLFSSRGKKSKAERAFDAALALHGNGVGTPVPVALVERRENGQIVESHFVSEYIPELSDFRRELHLDLTQKKNAERLMALIESVARAVRKFHDAGVIHRDLGNQNIGIVRNADGSARVFFLDLNRSRVFPPKSLTDEQRGKDLSHLDIPSGIFNEFLLIYKATKACRKAESKARKLFGIHAFLRPFRHPIREYKLRKLDGQPFIFRGSSLRAFRRNLWVWDERSAQAISLFSARDRLFFRPLSNILSAIFQATFRGFSFRKNFHRLNRESFSEPVRFAGTFGIALEENPDTREAVRNYLDRLQGDLRIPVLLRIYHHKGFEHRKRAVAWARELHERGNPVALALVQDRDALLRPDSWEKMLRYVFSETQDFAEFYEIGHAVNRGKWGIWDFRDYAKLLAPALEARRRFPHIRLTGPACIDFDLHSLPALLGKVPHGTFDSLSQHLYVDRRGAPENRQQGFGITEKCALHRAFARVYRCRKEKIIVSEVNWPLLNTGPWSPVGLLFPNSGPWESPPSVPENDYAKFMLRYWLLAIAGGHVSRLYWWRLDAHGYGLIDDAGGTENWRERPAFHVLKEWLKTLSDARFERRLDGLPDGHFGLEFSRGNGSRFTVKWTIDSMPELA